MSFRMDGPTRPLPLRGVLAFAMLFVAAASVAAQDRQPSPADIAAARALGMEGLKFAEEGNCVSAIEKLQKAEALFHAPTTLARLGECQIAVGKIVAGTENLQRVVREVLPSNASNAFVAAQERARATLELALPKIAMLTIEVKAPADFKPTVKVDDELVPPMLIGAPRATDPGTRKLEASAPGCTSASATLTLADGQHSSIVLTLEDCVAPAAPPVPSAFAPPSTGPAVPLIPPPVPPAPPARSHTTAYLALGLGGAGVIVGSVFGVVAMGGKSDLDKACKDKKCPATERSNIDALNRSTTWSTVGFGVGAAGLAIGAALLFWPSSAPPAADKGASRLAPPSLRARPWVGIGSAGLEGTF